MYQAWTNFLVIRNYEILKVVEFDSWHYLNIDDRIVSLSQPHIRPIVRRKAGKSVEFGAKLSAK